MLFDVCNNYLCSFFSPVKDFQESDYKTTNNELLIDALTNLGIHGARASGRNDIVIDNKQSVE